MDLLCFAGRFRTVGAWRDAMCAHGYSIPVQLSHGLSQAMTHLDLTFPEAFRLLWDKKKILVGGRALIYDFSASRLWEAGNRPPSTPRVDNAVDPIPPAIARHRDVLYELGWNEAAVQLERFWLLTLWRNGQ